MKNMKLASFGWIVAGALGVMVAFPSGAGAVDRIWADIGTDWNTAANWGGTAPTVADRAILQNVADTPTTNQPNLSASTTVNSVLLGQNGTIGGVTLSGDPGTAITLMSTNAATTAAFTSLSNGAGATPNVVSANAILGAAEGTTQAMYVRNTSDMPLFTVSGNVSSTNTVNLYLNLGTNSGNGIALTGCNSFTGDLYFQGSKVAYLSSIGNVGASSAAGAGSIIRIGGDAAGAGSTGNLYYTGGATTSNKTLDFSGAGGNRTIRHMGTGLLEFTGATTFTAGNKTLNFGANAADAQIEIQGDLAQGVGNVSLVRIINNEGVVTLSGNNSYSGNTEIGHGTLGRGGTLLINGNHTGAGQYLMVVNGGVAPFLGGSGMITMAGDTSITVVSGGGLTPGGNANGTWSAGTLTLDLNAGALRLDSMRANNAGRLIFDLAAPGGSDKVLLSDPTSTLIIGAATALTTSLEVSDFTFNIRPGFTAGVYTLFETSQTISGGLSTGAGLLDVDLGGGYSGTLSLDNSNTDIILTVIPEPGTAALALGGLAIFLIRRRRRG
jgi:autotransporter-associated beta strand protein